ncbi:YkgJ family cysteine cluster protein [soil metagenome]
MYSPLSNLKKNSKQRKVLKKFLTGLEKRNLRGIDSMAQKLNGEGFKVIDCLKCANCCKTMAPTFKKTEVHKIARHLGMNYEQYFKKYLKIDKEGDIMNKNTPCQHLGKDNMCSIYEIRPSDCSGFPHTHKRDFTEFIPETHIQNLDYCPATFYIVEKMFEKIEAKKLVN